MGVAMIHESQGKSDEYYTPKYVFEALRCTFDMDVSAPVDRRFCHVPANEFITDDSLNKIWTGFVWCNPPYCKRGDKDLWLDRMFGHGNGIALLPDRTSAPWWQRAARFSDGILFVNGKIKFIRPNGETADQPANGTTLFAFGDNGVAALLRAQDNGLGIFLSKPK